MAALSEALERLEALLRSRGAAVMELARPGIEARRLEQLLAPLGLTPSRGLLDWFGWHDGAGETGRTPSRSCELAPGCEFYSAELLAAECGQAREIADMLAADPQVPWSAELMWRRSWFPILRLFGQGLVTLDLSDDTVHVIWWDSPPEDRQRVRWSSLLAFTEELEARFRSGACTVGEDGVVQGETMGYP